MDHGDQAKLEQREVIYAELKARGSAGKVAKEIFDQIVDPSSASVHVPFGYKGVLWGSARNTESSDFGASVSLPDNNRNKIEIKLADSLDQLGQSTRISSSMLWATIEIENADDGRVTASIGRVATRLGTPFGSWAFEQIASISRVVSSHNSQQQ